RIDSANNLAMILNYSQEFVGQPPLVLNITVSDGLGSDWDTITVRVTEDFPPEVVQELPNVIMDEDTIAYPFNITQYFFDRDGDALYYTYGERNINITFLWNYTVQIIPSLNWFGTEYVTFRATDPTGALIEDTVAVTVLPVNDPPTIMAIEDQSGVVDVAWVLDLAPYLQDVDNPMSELIITTDSGSVIANGLNLTFRFSEPIETDIVTITVSDGVAQVYGQISITVAPIVTTGDDFPIPPWVLLPIIILLIVLGIFLAMKRKALVIEQAFLIYMDGALITHITNRIIPEMDMEIFSSMFTAIQDFIKDSFKDEKDWGLKKLEFGDSKIFLDRSKTGLVSLALVYEGNDAKIPKLAGKTLEAIESQYGEELKDWDGNLDNLRGSRDLLIQHLLKR
ncbi:MAG: hypothetical protein KAX31_07045, partial [Thermoplasmata archaeon]|nr:hypothetical protein [Thermoplasmata archaeon]